jgi:formate--tetrahydrofolate ligase
MEAKPVHHPDLLGDIRVDELISYGPFMAKTNYLSILERYQKRPNGKYIVITGVTPTPFGEGKTVSAISAAMGLNRMKLGSSEKKWQAVVCLRQPSLGPTLGIKGGGAGGGKCQLYPQENINLGGLTGDMAAITNAHNIIAGQVGAQLKTKNFWNLDPENILWSSLTEMGDSTLRNITRHIDRSKKNGGPFDMKWNFSITASSEIMAILALCQTPQEIRKQMGKIIVGRSKSGQWLTAQTIGAAGVASALLLLQGAHLPTLLQTCEATPALMHTGPFGNISHGNSSIVADQMALKLSDYVITEAGFGSDMGFERFINVKCRRSGLFPHAAGLVTTLRALKAHHPKFDIKRGEKLPPELTQNDPEALQSGLPNLKYHVQNILRYNIPVVIIINRFPTDHPDEIRALKNYAQELGVFDVVEDHGFQKGGEGSGELAHALHQAAQSNPEPKPQFLYDLNQGVLKNLKTLVQGYGGKDIEINSKAQKALEELKERGFNHHPICLAKTPDSISHDPQIKGAPKDFVVPIHDIVPCAGAQFIYALAGEVSLLPGWGSRPALNHIDLDFSKTPHGIVTGVI